MKSLNVKRAKNFELFLDDISSDKSISHRCAIFSMLSDKTSIVRNYLEAEDTLNTLNIVKDLGAKIEKDQNTIKITPPKSIVEPNRILDCGNSGTAMRLFCGFFAAIEGFFVLHGDKYLASRPMRRISKPLSDIGAKIDGRDNGNLSPLSVRGSKISSFDYKSKISSAQVKSAMILAALRADGTSKYFEPELSRDHTERMLKGMGAKIENENNSIIVNPLSKPLKPLDITVPADPSSGFFFAVAAAISNSKVTIKNISLNPTRIEAYKVLENMGANIEYILKEDIYEPIGDIVIKGGGELKGVTVDKKISWLIDELPALSIAMAVANGKSIVRNAKELRVKESDRISSVIKNLKKCTIDCKEFEDGYEITGGAIKGSRIDSFGDHRIAMSFAIAGLLDDMTIYDTECINTSFPNFIEILSRITKVEYTN